MYFKTKFTYKYTSIFFILCDYKSVTRIPIRIISLIIVLLHSFIYLICIAIKLRFYLLKYCQQSGFRVWICSLKVRYDTWSLNLIFMRLSIDSLLCFEIFLTLGHANQANTRNRDNICTQRNLFKILLYQPKIRLYLPFFQLIWNQTDVSLVPNQSEKS